jgi:biopolymer transport protein ExbB
MKFVQKNCGKQTITQRRAKILASVPLRLCASFLLAVLGNCVTTVAEEQVGAHSLSTPTIRIWDLAVAGGIFMIPIAGMSLLAVTMSLERFFALRRQRVFPTRLAKGLEDLARRQSVFDVREARLLCDRHPSAAANVVQAMLARAGRPASEIESAVAQTSQREADRLYANVRWLNLAASLSIMLGLIGTIQGMMMIFHQMQVTDPTADRAAMLAGGIYTKLVCTFAGLSVAIPSAFFSHLFEGRIQSLFREIEELVFTLLPQIERHEGQLRVSRQTAEGVGDAHGNGDAISGEAMICPRRNSNGGSGTSHEIARPPVET